MAHQKPGPWHYESDGGGNNQTFYVWRYNDAERGGIERKDFTSKQYALRFLKEYNPKGHAEMEREEMSLHRYRDPICRKCGGDIRVCTHVVCAKDQRSL